MFWIREHHGFVAMGKENEYVTENFVWEKTVVVRCKRDACANEVFF